MLYYLFTYLDKQFDFPGAGMFGYISFRSGMALIFSLLIALLFGKSIITFLKKKQVGESIRDLGLDGQMSKQGTPTMGGIIILLSLLVPVLLFGDICNIYILLMSITAVWLGLIGFLDDYIKVFKKDKKGLHGRFKILGQITLGVIVGMTFYFSDDIVVREHVPVTASVTAQTADNLPSVRNYITVDMKSTTTTIPFVKENEFDYEWLVNWMGGNAKSFVWIAFVLVIIFIVTAVSNGANITDGLDGLAAGTSAIVGITLGALAYLSGNIIYADYLNIMYIPHTGELVIFISAFIGATLGFLWYNTYPAQVFMGDTGSLAIGGIIAVYAILIRKELLIPILCGVFLAENISVMMQVSWFKYTKKKYGQGRRIFLMSPLHHHYQKKGCPEPRIVTRFWIVGILLAVMAIVTLKMR
ncbi:MAG: phospho-N-acetylmuramoyl-pentapeptide-transferase [Bacteroidales bacterium]|jgi:phospho-N-acetylmuramoyl-pentapeptide-transferase|nr:phospho-N-acetylmuramoyl-pentapeptide-transferase [Bacteroidales bacterium]